MSASKPLAPAISPERLAALSAFRAGRLAEAAEACERGIARVQEQGEQDECWLLRVLLSQCLCYQGDFNKAVALFEAFSLGADISTETRSRVLNQTAFGHSRMGNFVAARGALDEALYLANAVGLPALRAEIEINRATLLFYVGKYAEMEEHGRTALEIGEGHGLLMVEASACAALGKSVMYRERQAEAIPWFERALAVYEKEGAAAYADIMRSELGCCHFALGQDDKASGYFITSLEASRKAGALASLHIDLANMGCLHLRRGEYAAAATHFQEALEIADKLGDEISVSKWLENLALAYSYMGNPGLSASFRKQAGEVARQVDKARALAAM